VRARNARRLAERLLAHAARHRKTVAGWQELGRGQRKSRKNKKNRTRRG
jgi:hypothetical protein